jgi:pyridoxal phosphate enzyme (YggS family)
VTARGGPGGVMALVRDNLARVRERVAAACQRAARPVESVRLVGVTKTVGPALARELVEAGCGDLAESRPQALWAKQEALADLGDRIRWHFIGHLQRNKLRRTLPLCHLVHSLDSLRLLDAIAAEAVGHGGTVDVLIEVNLTGETARTGLEPAAVRPLLDAWPVCGVRLCGLMGMASAPAAGDPPDTARRQFAGLRALRDRIEAERPGLRLPELSMGMSGDYEDAILEGATLVRIGSALWEGVADG